MTFQTPLMTFHRHVQLTVQCQLLILWTDPDIVFCECWSLPVNTEFVLNLCLIILTLELHSPFALPFRRFTYCRCGTLGRARGRGDLAVVNAMCVQSFASDVFSGAACLVLTERALLFLLVVLQVVPGARCPSCVLPS